MNLSHYLIVLILSICQARAFNPSKLVEDSYSKDNISFESDNESNFRKNMLISRSSINQGYLFDIAWSSDLKVLSPPNSVKESAYLVELQKSSFTELIKTEILEKSYINYKDFGLQYFKSKPLTEKLLAAVETEVGRIVEQFKETYQRIRPDQVNLSIIPLMDVPDTYSYPSKVATSSFVCALILTSLDSQPNSPYIETATRMTELRMIAGINYKSDIFMGKKLSRYIIRKLLDDFVFMGLYLDSTPEWGSTLQAVKKLQQLTSLSMTRDF